MKRRCSDPRFKDYANYGARGIAVCDRWNASFAAFLEDMGERPSPDHSIDRLDSQLGYFPANCRWATSFQQGSENKRALKPVNVRGMSFHSMAAACRHFGVGTTTLNERLKAGIDLEMAITQPGRLASRRSRESYLPRSHPDRR